MINMFETARAGKNTSMGALVTVRLSASTSPNAVCSHTGVMKGSYFRVKGSLRSAVRLFENAEAQKRRKAERISKGIK